MASFLPEAKRFLALPDAFADPERADTLLLPVPYEATSSYGTGSCHGPAAILEASQQVEFFDARLGVEIFRHTGGIATLEPLPVNDCGGAVLAKRLQDAVKPWLDAGKQVITLGGEHSSIVGAVKAYAERYPEMTVLQLDAHSDLRACYEDNPWSHACAMARVAEIHRKCIQVGIRSQAAEERAVSEELGWPVIYGEALHDQEAHGIDWIAKVIDNTSEQVYITLDCDVLDPAVMPATGTPEPGGLTWRQINALLERLCRERTLVGFDVNELAPLPNITHPQFTLAKLIYRLIGFQQGF